MELNRAEIRNKRVLTHTVCCFLVRGSQLPSIDVRQLIHLHNAFFSIYFSELGIPQAGILSGWI